MKLEQRQKELGAVNGAVGRGEADAGSSDRTDAEEDLRKRAVRWLRRKREFRHHVEWFIVVNAVL